MVLRNELEVVCIASRVEHDVRLWWHSIHSYCIQWLVHVNGNWLQKSLRRKSTEFNRGLYTNILFSFAVYKICIENYAHGRLLFSLKWF